MIVEICKSGMKHISNMWKVSFSNQATNTYKYFGKLEGWYASHVLLGTGVAEKELNLCLQQTYVQNRTRLAKVALYETSQETSVSCTQLVVLYAPF